MKKIILAAVAAFALASCTTYNPIAINGEIGNARGGCLSGRGALGIAGFYISFTPII